MSTLLTGGTGFLGSALLKELSSAVVCSRNADRAKAKLGSLVSGAISWDPLTEPLDLSSQPKFDSVINLMGEPIAEGRWTKEKKQKIRDSRVLGTRRLVDALIEANNLPSVFVSASAVGIYGDAGEDLANESHDLGSGFLPEVCQEWEHEANRISEHGVRVVNLRIGIVLGKESGALAQMVPIFRWGIGGPMGNGKRWFPWIHVSDLVDMILWAVETDSVNGPVNATAPNPVRNKEFTRALAKRLRRPAFLPAPKFALRLALGEFADSLVYSQRVIPEAALTHGYHFQFSELHSALSDLIP